MMAGELVGWKNALGLSPYGERFREYRRYMAKSIGGKTQMQKHLGLVEDQTRKFLGRLIKDPEHVVDHIRKYVVTTR